jgi:hypothetical protein
MRSAARGDGGRVQGLPPAGPTQPPTSAPANSTVWFGAPLELPPTASGATGDGATDALALPPLRLGATLRFKDAFLLCATNTQGCRRA